jgi:hypothetical protein
VQGIGAVVAMPAAKHDQRFAISGIAAHPCKKRKDGAATFRYGKRRTERWRRVGQPPRIYSARLHRQEAAAILRSRFEQMHEFLREHFLESRKREGVDTSALDETLRKMALGLEAIESTVKVSN